MTAAVRPLTERDLPEADRIFRLAFGTFVRLPNPLDFSGDAEILASRWRGGPAAAFAAWSDGRFVGSNWLARWGSVGLFGPLSVEPALWGAGLGKALLEPTLEFMRRPEIAQAGLFTFAESALHVGLYQRFGYWPGALTAVMEKAVAPGAESVGGALFSEVAEGERASCLDACGALTNAVYDGLDVRSEILSVERQRMGDTVLLLDGSRLAALAVCHVGPKSEAGSGTLYVKFGAAAPGAQGAETLTRLLAACEALARRRGVARLVAGTSAARRDAFLALRAFGLRPFIQGIAMHLDGKVGFNRPDAFVIDDWR